MLGALFAQDAPEDEVLARIALPRIVDRVIRIVVVGNVATGLVAIMTSSTEYKPFNIAIVLVAFLPWVLWMTGTLAARRLFAGLVLLPAAAIGLVRLVGGTLSEDGTQFFLNLAMVMLVLFALAPRREAAQVFVLTYVTFLGLGLLSQQYINCIIWMVALTFVVFALVGTRAGALEIARAQKRLTQAQATDARRQIARDVHDVVAHTLAVTMLHLTAARMAVHRGAAEDATEALDEAERQGLASLTDVRRVLQLLQPTQGATPPASLDAIPALVEKYRGAGLPVTLTVSGEIDCVTPTNGITVYRVVQEALANAARHGDGSATVELDVADGGVDLAVTNPARRDGDRPAGNGIRGMRERVESLGGTISVGPDSGEWRVHVVLAPVRSGTTEPTGART